MEYASNKPGQTLSADDILRAIKDAAAQPVLMGTLYGFPVYFNRSVPEGVIEIRGSETIRFSVDHPYVQGTTIERTARAILNPDK
jgi:hypothetical protein